MDVGVEEASFAAIISAALRRCCACTFSFTPPLALPRLRCAAPEAACAGNRTPPDPRPAPAFEANAAAAARTMGSEIACRASMEWRRGRKAGFVVNVDGEGGLVGEEPSVNWRVEGVGGVGSRERM